MLLTPMSGLTPEISPAIETILIQQNEVNEYLEERLKDIPEEPVLTDSPCMVYPEDKNDSDELINMYSRLMNEAIEEHGEYHDTTKKYYVKGQCIIYYRYYMQDTTEFSGDKVDFIKRIFNKIKSCPYYWAEENLYQMKYIKPAVEKLVEGGCIDDALFLLPFKALTYYGW